MVEQYRETYRDLLAARRDRDAARQPAQEALALPPCVDATLGQPESSLRRISDPMRTAD